MLAIMMHTYSDRDIKWRMGIGTTHKRFQHKIWFNERVYCFVIRNWLSENIPGKYTIEASHVVFENYDDALLCYLRLENRVHVVFFDPYRWGHTEESIVDKWIKENALGGYSFPANYVVFDDHDDALMCYLRFTG